MDIRRRKKIIAIIPARGGSKGILRKNLKKLCGHPLVSYPISLARSLANIDRVIVSSEDPDILSCARRYGAETPFVRPRSLARDTTPTLPVLRHCVRYLEEHEGYRPDYILLLYPTSPLLKKKHVQGALTLLVRSARSCVVSVERDLGKFWRMPGRQKPQLFYPRKRVNRQWQKPLYRENGGIYAMDYRTLMTGHRIVDPKHTRLLVMEPDELIDIDTMLDWDRAEARLNA